MSTNNYGRLGREYTGRNLRIGDKLVIDNKANLEAANGQFRGNVRIRGNLEVDGAFNQAPQVLTFPGDTVPQIPDYIICGYGCMGAALAKTLTDDLITRVLVFEMGADNSNNPLVTQPFAAAPYRGDGPIIINAVGVLLDPSITTFNGAPQGPGDGWSLKPLWTGTGDGGGNQHFLLDKVNMPQYIADGPLPAGIIPPNNVTVKEYSAAGSNCTVSGTWSYANISNIIKSLENFQQSTGYGTSITGASENIGERGTSGPMVCLQLAPSPPSGGSLLVQTAFSNAATTVPGGDVCNLVDDYNCNIAAASSPSHLNCTSQNQNYLNNTFNRQGSQTGFMGGSITASDGNGNLVGLGGRKLIVINNAIVTAPYRSPSSNTTYIAGGVYVLQGNSLLQYAAKNVVCAMGGGYSPRFWQLGGIGPADLLTRLGIPRQISGPSVEFIGNGLHTQYGPLFQATTTNPYFAGIQFPGQCFTQYRNTPRKFQCVAFSLGGVSIGLIGGPAPSNPVPPAQQKYLIQFDGFIASNRARKGYANTIASTYRPQLDFNWGFYTDVPVSDFTATINGNVLTLATPPAVPLLVGQTISGAGVRQGTMIIAIISGQSTVTPGVGPYPAPSAGAVYHVSPTYDGAGSNPAPILSPVAMSLDPNDPMSGLSDPDSDMSTACAFSDFLWQTLLQLRSLDGSHTYDFVTPTDIQTVLQVTPDLERWRQLAQILPYALSVSAHEQGTVVMGPDANSGAVNGNFKLYGTGNCFECSGAIMPIQNAGNPTALQQAIGVIAGQVIPDVAL